MSLSPKAQQQILRQRMHAMFPYLLKITFPSFGTFRYSNTDDDIYYEEDDNVTYKYTACTFSINPPEKTESKIGDGRLNFSSIYNNHGWIKKIRTCPYGEIGKVEVVGAIIYTAGQTVDGIEAIYDTEFMLSNASWSDDGISWDMKFDDGMDVVMPCDELDEIICPGVV